MTIEELKKKVALYKWEFWADRPFGAFIVSLFKDGQTREYMRRVGVDCEWPAMLFQNGAWWRSEEVWDDFANQLEENLKKGVTVFDVVKKCERYHDTGLKKIKKLLLEKKSEPTAKLGELYEILTQIISYVWLAHGFEHLYLKRLREEVPKYYTGDVDKFIGDISFPSKKNTHAFLVEALRSDELLESVQKRFAWIKVRDGFSEGFTLEELVTERQKLKKEKGSHEFKRAAIPPELQELAAVSQELVYFRTLRTDILYEFMWVARPIFQDVAKELGIPFLDLRNYSVQDILAGKPKAYSKEVCGISYGREFALLDEPLVKVAFAKTSELKGTIAFKGVVRGVVKIVKIAHEIGKVKEGDILVAPTTAPSFIIGMQRAAAFVTDEGGITSHTAIVAREMRKPCIIGTKIATKVLKDGDEIEINANTGIVKIISRYDEKG